MPIVGPFGEVVGQAGARAYLRTVTRLRPSSSLMAWKDTPSRRSAWIRWYQSSRHGLDGVRRAGRRCLWR
jgi:hypothetical protein